MTSIDRIFTILTTFRYMYKYEYEVVMLRLVLVPCWAPLLYLQYLKNEQ